MIAEGESAWRHIKQSTEANVVRTAKMDELIQRVDRLVYHLEKQFGKQPE